MLLRYQISDSYTFFIRQKIEDIVYIYMKTFFLPVKIKFLAIQYSRYSSTYIFVVGSNCLSLNRVDILQWTRGEPNHEVKVRRRSSEEVEVVAHGNCRSAIHTLVQGTFQVRCLQYTCMHHCGKTMGWLPLRFGIGSRR